MIFKLGLSMTVFTGNVLLSLVSVNVTLTGGPEGPGKPRGPLVPGRPCTLNKAYCFYSQSIVMDLIMQGQK